MENAWSSKKSWTSHFNMSVHKKTAVFKEHVLASKSSTNGGVRDRGVIYGDLEPIPVDPKIDPNWDLCYNFWKIGHLHKECTKPQVFEYCRNCGRRGVNWTTCPKCANGYRDHQMWRVENKKPEFKEHDKRPMKSKNLVETKSEDSDVSVSVTKTKPNDLWLPVVMPIPFEKKSEPKKTPVYSVISDTKSKINSFGNVRPVNSAKVQFKPVPVLFQTAMREIILQNNCAKQSIDNKQIKKNSSGESIVSSGEEECMEGDKDLEKIIVDEDETSLSQQCMSDTTRDFISLIKSVKHLPFQTQNIMVEQFVKEQRALMVKKEMEKLSYGLL